MKTTSRKLTQKDVAKQRKPFYESLGLSMRRNYLYCIEREYAVPECIATAIVVRYYIDDRTTVRLGSVYTHLEYSTLIYPLKHKDNPSKDGFFRLNYFYQYDYYEDGIKESLEREINDIETRLKNVFGLERIT